MSDLACWGVALAPTNNPCPTAFSGAPVLDKQGFCAAFKKTIDFIWDDFKTTQCTGLADGTAQKNQCLVAAIIGSAGRLEIFVRDGSAAAVLGASRGTAVRVRRV